MSRIIRNSFVLLLRYIYAENASMILSFLTHYTLSLLHSGFTYIIMRSFLFYLFIYLFDNMVDYSRIV